MTPIRFLSDKATGDTDVCHLYFFDDNDDDDDDGLMDDTKGMGVTHV